MKNKICLYIVFILTILISSCVPQSKILYLQNLPSETELVNIDYEPILKPDDLLHIQIKTLDIESSDVFNLNAGITNNISGIKIGYLIDKYGNIEFPIIGKIKAAGFKKSNFTEEIRKELKKHLKNFSLDVRIANFKYSVLGEVNNPGEFEVSTDRITLIQAIAKAGDITIYGNRNTIQLMREENNTFKRYFIDFSKSDFIPSELYYLRQNDVIYIEPRRAKADNVAISTNITTTISIISSLITLYLITTRL
jgi:polysaccharide export outer membrane protein